MQAVIEPNTKPQPAVRLRPIALPSEHGGWGMLGAPILAGLLVSPSWSGLFLGLAGLGAFLSRQPFRLALTDLRKGKRYPRTAWAIRFAAIYAVAGAAAFAGAARFASGQFWSPLLLAATLGGIQFSFDIRGKGRSFFPEVAGASALALLGTAISLAAGSPMGHAWLIALFLALQSTTAISYAAARVRLARNVAVSRSPIWVGHAAALGVVAAFVISDQALWPLLAAFSALLLRALWGLSPYRRNVRAAMVGLQEVGYSLLTVTAIFVSFRLAG